MSTQSVSRTIAPFIAGLALTLAGAAHAQEQVWKYATVEAAAYTSPYLGTYNNSTGRVTGPGPVTALADPEPGTWYNGNAEGDTYATTTATLGVLTGVSNSWAQRHGSASGSATSNTFGQYKERVRVVSSLPANTPVTLVFRQGLNVAAAGHSFYSGKVIASLNVGYGSTSAQWRISTSEPQIQPTVPPVGRITIDTTVGSLVYITGQLTTEAKASLLEVGEEARSLRVDASSSWHLEQAPAGVWLEREDGSRIDPETYSQP